MLRRIKELGGREVRKAKGSHVRVCCACEKNVAGKNEVPKGTLRKIQKDLAPCPSFGDGWLLGK